MKVIILVSVLLAVVAGDWSKARPIHELPSFQARFPLYKELESASFGARVVGGQNAVQHQIPHQVGIFMDFPDGQGLCGGSIISETYILTAAHCVDVIKTATVIVGAHNITSTSEPTQVRFPVTDKNFIVHPNWTPNLIRNDIALIKLSTPIKLSDVVRVVRLPSRDQASQSFEGRTATVSGWGVFSDALGAISPILQHVQVPVISNTRCRIRFPGIIQDSNICTSGDNGRSSCSGDSGGPLTFVDADGQPTQIGIVSFGLALGCERGWPSAFVRVTSYLDWIQANTQ